MPATYENIATTTLGSGQSSVTFSSISGNYTDLILVTSATSATQGSLLFRVNGDTGSNYSYTILWGNGSAAQSARATNQTSGRIGSIYGTIDNSLAHFQNYSNTTTNKTILTRYNMAGAEVMTFVNLWRSTAAITSIQVLLGSGNFDSGSTFTLYGIKAA